MKELKFSAALSAILGTLGVLALIFLYLALSDIAGSNGDSTLEWYIAGICMIILAAFNISALITLGFTFRYFRKNRH